MTSFRVAALATACATLSAGQASAAPISPTYKVVRSGAVAPMGFHYYLAEGCRSAGKVEINVLTAPQNGDLSEGPRIAYPSFNALSPLAVCNHRKVRGTEIYYQSHPGYTGPDSYEVERVFPNGDAQRFRIEVSVR